MNEFGHQKEKQNIIISDVKSRKPLSIFKTTEDKYGRDISVMSDFFDGYVHDLSLSFREQSSLEVINDFSIASLGMVNELIHTADVVARENMTLLPDFDNLPLTIKNKLQKGIYTVGKSKQVDGNYRPVILDENGVRVKDITLKKVINTAENSEIFRNIGNQIQMRQIYCKLADIQEIQSYQLEKDRDRDIVIPFLDARTLIVESENITNQEEKLVLLKEADAKIRNALNAIYADIETTSKRFAKSTETPFFTFGNQMNTYMRFLVSDLQIATKFVGIRMQLLDYMEEKDISKTVLQNYYHVLYDFLTKPITRKGISTGMLMQDYFPYNKLNIDCWYNFSKEMKPVLENNLKRLELDGEIENSSCIYVISLEDIGNEAEE